jgi:ribosomal protein L16 Arg81 hydroxylase
MFTARLVAADWLYIPATWWHLVKCAEDALSISVGIMSPAALARAKRLPPGWTGAA